MNFAILIENYYWKTRLININWLLNIKIYNDWLMLKDSIFYLVFECFCCCMQIDKNQKKYIGELIIFMKVSLVQPSQKYHLSTIIKAKQQIVRPENQFNLQKTPWTNRSHFTHVTFPLLLKKMGKMPRILIKHLRKPYSIMDVMKIKIWTIIKLYNHRN